MRTGSVLAGVASGFVAATWGYRAVFVFCVMLASTASVVLFIFNYQRGAKIFSDSAAEPVVQSRAVSDRSSLSMIDRKPRHDMGC